MQRVEVKVCERCGGLWLRPAATNGERGLIYCSPCARVMAELPPARKELPNGRRKKKDKGAPSFAPTLRKGCGEDRGGASEEVLQ